MKSIKITILPILLFCIINTSAMPLNQGIENSSDQINDTIKKNDSLPIKTEVSSTTEFTSDRQLYHITKNDNTEYVGNILSDDGREVLIVTENLGKIYIPKSEIMKIEKVESVKSVVRGEYYDAGPFVTRYAFTTNALPIKKGSNYALINLYGPEVHFALTDNFSVGVMTTWIASPFVGVLKYSFKTRNEKLHFSLGTLLGTSSYINSFKGFGGLHFGNVTLGDVKKNITLAAGYGYISSGEAGYYDDFGNYVKSNGASGPIFSIAGITKVGVKASFIFDSMIGVVNSNDSQAVAMFLMPGMRFQTSDKKAFQISLAGVTVFDLNNGESNTFPLPMCTWFYKF